MTLDSRLEKDISRLHIQMERDGKLVPTAKLKECYELFRQRFGPDALGQLDGETLLDTLHAHGNRDSLVYWLEFKDDDEMPARFGSIAGGSALKFGIYRSAESGEWMTGSPQSQRRITVGEAVECARRHRAQLLKGCELLSALPASAPDETYAALQRQMEEAAPTVGNLAWGHKYFSMLFPDKLDDYHVPAYQRFHLMKLLQIPPEGDGRYLAAGRYVEIAGMLGVPMNHLTTVLNHRDGNPYRYWRIGTKLGGEDSIWGMMHASACVAVGWSKIGDLSDIEYRKESKERIRSLLSQHYPNDVRTVGRQTQQLFNFVAAIAEGDLVAASDGGRILAVGKVTGPYSFAPDSNAPHRRPVKWLSVGEHDAPEREGLQTTVYELTKPSNLVHIEGRLLDAEGQPQVPAPPPGTRRHVETLPGTLGRIQAVLERKGQVVLYGPPGTGKTHWAERAACELAARHNFGSVQDQLAEAERLRILGVSPSKPNLVRTCCFHPSYGYEDFMEGYRPASEGGDMRFELRDGIFKRLCDDAADSPSERFYLVIDEINRGDIPRIFGELLTVMEKGKRGKTILLPVSGRQFRVPENVFVIGTMNTADRSIALLDTALRRRFGFVELMPNYDLLKDAVVEGVPLGLWLKSLNQRICQHVGRDARNLQIGHSYLMDGGRPIGTGSHLSRVVREDIIPLLEEYCYEDYNALEKILGSAMVDLSSLGVREELFDDAHRPELVRALLAPCPDISASAQLVEAEAERPEEGEDTDEQGAASEGATGA